MVYSTSRCPTCGQVIRRQTNPVKEIGIPFERCRHCGTTYLNSYKEEWITKSPFSRFFFFLQAGVWARAIMLPMLILFIPIAAFDLSTDVVWALWPILSLVWLIGGYSIHKKAEQEDIAASLERTKDPKYVDLLKQAGYAIYPIDEETTRIASVVESKQEAPMQTEEEKNEEKPCFCRCCGEKLTEDSRFCHKCGTEVVELSD